MDFVIVTVADLTIHYSIMGHVMTCHTHQVKLSVIHQGIVEDLVDLRFD